MSRHRYDLPRRPRAGQYSVAELIAVLALGLAVTLAASTALHVLMEALAAMLVVVQ